MSVETLCRRIDQLLTQRPQTLVAIDGACGSGKTTLAKQLQARYGGHVLQMDHFFLRPEQRTPARFAEPGGNVDYERFLAEVLTPLQADEPFYYRPFDCKTGQMGEGIEVLPGPLYIIEGSYSLHPTLVSAYHLNVFLTVDPAEQLRRLALRDGGRLLQRFRDEWIPMEQRYFTHYEIAKQCDFVMDTTKREQQP